MATSVKKTYTCGICNNEPTQLSHHKAHLQTKKHKVKKELFQLQLAALTDAQRMQQYQTHCVADIVTEKETVLYEPTTNVSCTTPEGSANKKRKQAATEASTLTNKVSSVKKDDDAVEEEAKDVCDSTEFEKMQQEKVEQSLSVSNKEALKNLIHDIHNYLRNHGAGYGMGALKVFNLFMGLKKMEEHELLSKFQLTQACRFSYLLELAKEGKHEQLMELIYHTVLDELHRSPLKPILFYEIPIRNIKANVISGLLQYIDNISTVERSCNVQLSGKIYEYFIGRDETAISELGAYFTDRHIVNYILEKLDPCIGEDGHLGTMIDMFGGSGGFTTGYIHYLAQKYPTQINWATEIDQVFHFDMNEDVIKSAALEFLCLTGVLPNMETNMGYRNSFTNNFYQPGSVMHDTTPHERKFTYVLTNPPYGGDKNAKSEASLKREKVKAYIKNELSTLTEADDGLRIKRQKQLKLLEQEDKAEKAEQDKTKVTLATCGERIQRFAQRHHLKGNDKESCSLMLIMDTLAEGGTAIGVLKEGVFFNPAYKDLRRVLVDNFNVREVISVPNDQFENTTTKTSIVIFDHTPSQTTSQVVFRNLVVDKFEEDRFEEIHDHLVLVENKGDIRGLHEETVKVVTIAEIRKNENVSLLDKDYQNLDVLAGAGYELLPLGSITDICIGATPSTKNHHYWENGEIPWVAISDMTTDVMVDTGKRLTAAGAETMKHRKVSRGSILLSFKLTIGKLAIAGVDMYCNEAIAFLNSKLPHVPQEYLFHVLKCLPLEQFGRGTIGKNGNLNKDILQKILVPIPTDPAKTQRWVELLSLPYQAMLEATRQIERLEKEIQERIQELCAMEDECDFVELGTLCEMKPGKALAKEHFSDGPYPVVGGGMSPAGYSHLYNTKKDSIVCSSAGNAGYISKYAVEIWATNNCFTIESFELNNTYLYYLLKEYQETVFAFKKGSVQQQVRPKELAQMVVALPKNRASIDHLMPRFEMLEQVQRDLLQHTADYQAQLANLKAEAIQL